MGIAPLRDKRACCLQGESEIEVSASSPLLCGWARKKVWSCNTSTVSTSRTESQKSAAETKSNSTKLPDWHEWSSMTIKLPVGKQSRPALISRSPVAPQPSLRRGRGSNKFTWHIVLQGVVEGLLLFYSGLKSCDSRTSWVHNEFLRALLQCLWNMWLSWQHSSAHLAVGC